MQTQSPQRPARGARMASRPRLPALLGHSAPRSGASPRLPLLVREDAHNDTDHDDHDDQELPRRRAALTISRIISARASTELATPSRASGAAVSARAVSSEAPDGQTSGLSACRASVDVSRLS